MLGNYNSWAVGYMNHLIIESVTFMLHFVCINYVCKLEFDSIKLLIRILIQMTLLFGFSFILYINKTDSIKQVARA